MEIFLISTAAIVLVFLYKKVEAIEKIVSEKRPSEDA